MKKNNSDGKNPAELNQAEDNKPEEIVEDINSPEAEQAGSDSDELEKNSEIQALMDQLKAKETEYAEISEKYLRMAAEYDNFRRRSQKEKEAIYIDSVTRVVKEWLPVLDNLDRAAQVVEQVENEEAVKIGEGILLTRKQAYEIMESLGVCEIDCLNNPFDPNLHDAVMHVEDDSVGPSTVVEVLQKGYIRGETVIRHSIVKVAN